MTVKAKRQKRKGQLSTNETKRENERVEKSNYTGKK